MNVTWDRVLGEDAAQDWSWIHSGMKPLTPRLKARNTPISGAGSPVTPPATAEVAGTRHGHRDASKAQKSTPSGNFAGPCWNCGCSPGLDDVCRVCGVIL